MTSLLQLPLLRILPFVKRMAKSSQTSQATGSPAVAEPTSFYRLSSQLHTGQLFPFASLKGKQVLLVNTAADTTDSLQYQELQQLAARFADKLVVLVFPTNDFAAPALPAAPAAGLGTTDIPLMQPSGVIKNSHQNPVYHWLSHARQNGWNEQAPPRPFAKYLVSATGQLAHYFGPTLSPLSDTVIERISNPAF